MRENVLKEKIYTLCCEGKIPYKSKRILLRNLTKINAEIEKRGVSVNSLNFFDELLDVCNYVLTTNSYTFKSALKEHNVENEYIFLTEYWNSEITVGKLKKISLKMSELYQACETYRFLDCKSDITAYQFITGDFSEEDFELLLEVLDKENFSYAIQGDIHEETTCVGVDISFDAIVSAKELRNNLSERINIESETERVLSEIYNNLQVSVFKGVSDCIVRTPMRNKDGLDFLCKELTKHEFQSSLQEDKNSYLLVVQPIPAGGDYTMQYSEAQLTQMLDAHLGSVYHFVAVYCEKVLLPKLLNNAINSVVKALNEVTINDSSVKIRMIETKTNTYKKLFEVLRKKGFDVNISGTEKLEFEMRW